MIFGNERNPDAMRAIAMTDDEWRDVAEALALAMEQQGKLRVPAHVQGLLSKIQENQKSSQEVRHILDFKVMATKTLYPRSVVTAVQVQHAESPQRTVATEFSRYAPPGASMSDLALGIVRPPAEAWAMLDEACRIFEATVAPKE